jgi:hypothetical protein
MPIESSRELDYEVATKVLRQSFGAKWHFSESCLDGIFYTDAPNYSVEIKEAMQILAFFETEGLVWNLACSLTWNGYFCSLYSKEGVGVTVGEKTPALAICSAALAWTERDIESTIV